MSDLLFTGEKCAIISPQPQPVARLYIDPNFSIMLYKKPNWFHRKMTKWFFGWDVKDETNKQLLHG